MSIIKSIFDFNFYNKIYKNSGWKTFIYLLLISLLIYYLGTFVQIGKLNSIFNTEVTTYINNLPEFRIENGELTVNSHKPLIFETSLSVLIVDATSNKIPDEYARNTNVLLLANDRIILKKGIDLETVKYETVLGNFKLQSIDKGKLIDIMPLIKAILFKYLIIIYILWYILWLPFYKMWSILALSLIGLFIDYKLKSGLIYKEIFNISVYAITLPWIIKLLYKAVGLHNYFPWIVLFAIYWVVAGTYEYYAIKSIMKNKNFDMDDHEELEQKEVQSETSGFQEIEEFTLE